MCHDVVYIRTLEGLARKIVRINQGYFEARGPDTSFRVMTEDLAGSVIAAFITVKTGEGLVRNEFEVELPDRKFARLLFEKSHHRISKQRYYIDDWGSMSLTALCAELFLLKKKWRRPTNHSICPT